MATETSEQTSDAITVSVEEAAKRLGVGRRTCYRIIESDPSFPAYKIGRRTVVSVEGLREWDSKRRSERAA